MASLKGLLINFNSLCLQADGVGGGGGVLQSHLFENTQKI